MADDPNKSGKGPQNTLNNDDVGEDWGSVEEYLASQHQQQLEHIQRVNRPRGAKLRKAYEDIRSAEKAQNQIRQSLNGHPDADILMQPFTAEVRRARNVVNEIYSGSQERAESQYSTLLSRQFSSSSISGQISRLTHTTDVQQAGLAAGMNSYTNLESRRQEEHERLREIHRQSQIVNQKMWLPGGEADPEQSRKMRRLESQRIESEKQLAIYEVGLRGHRQAGTDPQGVLDQTRKMYGRVLQEAQYKEEQARGGVTLSSGQSVKFGKDVETEYQAASQRLIKAFDDLAKGTEATGKSLEELTKDAENAAKDVKTLGDAMSSGGGRRDFTGALSVASAGFQAIGAGYQAVMVNQRIAQQQNIAGFANIENEKYDMYRKARTGDIQSQMLLGAWDQAAEFGSSAQVNTKVGQGLKTGGHMAQATAGGLKVSAAGSGAVQSLVFGGTGANAMAAGQGLQEAISGTTAAVVEGADIARNISGGANNIAAQQARMQAMRGLTYVQAQQLQGFRDLTATAGMTSMQMGQRSGEAFMNEVVSDKNMDRMIAARMSPEQFNKLSQIGVEQIGSTFAVDQVYAAKGLERAGFGTAEQNMQRMATLANAGSNNPQAALGSVLEAAFSKGLEGSKVLNMMAENTAAMVQGNAAAMAAGIDTTAAAATLLTGYMDPNQVNKEFATQRAMTAAQVAKDVSTNIDVSFSGMVNTARTQTTTGLGQIGAMYATKLTTEELRTLEGKSDEEVRAAMRKRGVNLDETKMSPQEFIQQQLKNQMMSLVEGKGSGFALMNADMRQSIVNKAMNKTSYDQLTKEEQTALGQVGSQFNLAGDEYYRTITGVKEQNTKEGEDKAAEGMEGEGAGEGQKTAYEMATSGMKQLAEAAKQGTTAFKGAKEAFQALGEFTKNIEARGQEVEERMTNAAAEAAKDWKSSVGVFNIGADKILQAAKILSEKAGIDSADAVDYGKQIKDEQDAKK